MSRLGPVSFNELVRRLRVFGFEGPYSGGKHLFMLKGNLRLTIPNPHKQKIGVDLLTKILRQAGIPREEWTKMGFGSITQLATTLRSRHDAVNGFFDNRIKISFAAERKGEIKRNYSDIAKAKKILGFSPEISLKDGVREAYEGSRTRNVEDVKNAQILSGSE